MATSTEPFGAQLYAELRRLTGFKLLGAKLDYTAIQELKLANRAATARLLAAGDPGGVKGVRSRCLVILTR